ncbi:MAG: hypothetical protein ABEJ04_01740 [Halobacteriaceae archaeon]
MEGDAADCRRRLRERAEGVRERELERALRRLEGEGSLTEAQRAALDRFTRDLVDGLLAPVESELDPETAPTAARLLFED